METTLNELLDQSVEQMTPGQRRRFERRCRFVPGYRAEYIRELRDNLLDDPRFLAAAPMATAVMGADGFTGETRFEIDGSNLKAILDIILEYGPKLLDLILLFIKAFSVIAAIAVLPAASATAMDGITIPETVDVLTSLATEAELPLESHILAQWGVVQNCPGGVCPLPAPTSNVRRLSYPTNIPVPAINVGSNYRRQWFNHDGRSLRQHAEVMHGHDTAGLSDSQVAYLNDADHNSWGHGGHPHAGTHHHTNQAVFPVARATAASIVRVTGGVARTTRRVAGGTARVAAAPIRYVAQRQPVRRLVNALRPRNVVGRIRSRRGW